MVVTQHDVGDAGEVDAEYACIAKDGVRVSAGIEQHTVTAYLYESGEPPFPDGSAVGQIRREDGHLSFVGEVVRCLRSGLCRADGSGEPGKRQDVENDKSSNATAVHRSPLNFE
jgi:hypothetical protein